jgi:peptide/nickel transport system substrate-binding protein
MKTIASICAVALMTAVITAAHAGSKNNSLTIALSEPIDGVSEFDAPSDEGQLHTRAVLDRLLSVDSAQGKLMPLLARSWKQINPTTWEFDLRSDVKFHDGSVFDADDAVYTLNWASDPKVNLRLKNRFTWVDKAEKLGPNSIRIKTVRPYALALYSLAVSFPMVPSDYHGKLENKSDFGWKPVGTGSYKAISVDRNAGIVLVPNENYVQANSAQPKATIGRVVIKSIADEQTRMAQMMVDNVELTRVVSTDVGGEMKGDKRFAITAVNGLQYFYLYLDAANRTGTGVLKDARVRQAIAHAIDRDAIRREIVPGGKDAFALKELCVPFQVGCASTVALPAYDPARARALLKEAGMEKGFDLELTALDRSRPIAEAISGYLSRVGIRSTIKTVTFTAYTKLQGEGKFQGLVHIYGSGGVPDTGQLLSFHFNNKVRDYAHDPRINEIAGQAETMSDMSARNKLIQEALDINNRQSYVIPLSGAPQAFVHIADLVVPTTTLNGYGIVLSALAWK